MEYSSIQSRHLDQGPDGAPHSSRQSWRSRPTKASFRRERLSRVQHELAVPPSGRRIIVICDPRPVCDSGGHSKEFDLDLNLDLQKSVGAVRRTNRGAVPKALCLGIYLRSGWQFIRTGRLHGMEGRTTDLDRPLESGGTDRIRTGTLTDRCRCRGKIGQQGCTDQKKGRYQDGSGPHNSTL